MATTMGQNDGAARTTNVATVWNYRAVAESVYQISVSKVIDSNDKGRRHNPTDIWTDEKYLMTADALGDLKSVRTFIFYCVMSVWIISIKQVERRYFILFRSRRHFREFKGPELSSNILLFLQLLITQITSPKQHKIE